MPRIHRFWQSNCILYENNVINSNVDSIQGVAPGERNAMILAVSITKSPDNHPE